VQPLVDGLPGAETVIQAIRASGERGRVFGWDDGIMGVGSRPIAITLVGAIPGHGQFI
jgi:hypothetical protein